MPNGLASAGSASAAWREVRRHLVDTLALVNKNDRTGGKVRIKVLETRWDKAEPSPKPRAATEWHVLDKAIDKALAALRTGTPYAATCKTALAVLLAIVDRFGGNA